MASKRGYTTTTEVDELVGTTGSTDVQINEAEEIIDDYVGYQDKFLDYEIRGLLAAGGVNNLTLEQIHQNNMQLNYLRGCWIEIMGGAGEGQRAKITAQTLAGVVTLETNLSVATDITSYYRIYQLGKFPRQCDTEFDGLHTPTQYRKSIPDKVRRATAAQVEFMINQGKAFFGSDAPDMESESIGDYSYSKAGRGSGVTAGAVKLIAPKAKLLLKGIINRTGSIV